MADAISVDLFKKALLECLEETFERVNGIYLDKKTSMFETLDNVSAEDASRSIAEGSASIAAQVEHVRFYLDVLDDVMRKEQLVKVDWRDIWQRVREVTPEQWNAQKRTLRESYERVGRTIRNYDKWQGEYGIECALAILAHTAYHLGGIRQALGAIRSRASQVT